MTISKRRFAQIHSFDLFPSSYKHFRYLLMIIFSQVPNKNLVHNGVVSETISSIVLWVLWISRCQRIFQEMQWNIVDVVKEIWLTLVHTLKGEYDTIKGYLDVVFWKKDVLKKRWERLNVFCRVNACIRSRYRPSLWVQLFLVMLWEICMSMTI